MVFNHVSNTYNVNILDNENQDVLSKPSPAPGAGDGFGIIYRACTIYTIYSSILVIQCMQILQYNTNKCLEMMK